MTSEFFDRQGYVLLKGVLNREQCRLLRARIQDAFRTIEAARPDQDLRFLPPSVSFSIPEVWAFPVHERITAALSAILEPRYTLIPDLQVQRDTFGFGQINIQGIRVPRWGWHQDTGSEGYRPQHMDPRYRFVKCGLYLQDNTAAYGGSVDIVAGSHRLPLRTGDIARDWKIRQVVGKARIMLEARTLPIEAGDALLFDSYLWHASTLPAGWQQQVIPRQRALGIMRLPQPHEKLTVYFNACRAFCAEAYMQHSLARARTEHADALNASHAAELFYCDYLDLGVSGNPPAEFLHQVERAGLRVAALEGAPFEEAARLRRESVMSGRVNNVLPQTV